MWQFVGEIEYECSKCSEKDSIPIEDFNCECIGGDDRSMGAEEIYELSYLFECNECSNDIELKFEV